MKASFPQQRLPVMSSRYFVLKSREKPQDLDAEKKRKKEHEKVLTNDSG